MPRCRRAVQTRATHGSRGWPPSRQNKKTSMLKELQGLVARRNAPKGIKRPRIVSLTPRRTGIARFLLSTISSLLAGWIISNEHESRWIVFSLLPLEFRISLREAKFGNWVNNSGLQKESLASASGYEKGFDGKCIARNGYATLRVYRENWNIACQVRRAMENFQHGWRFSNIEKSGWNVSEKRRAYFFASRESRHLRQDRRIITNCCLRVSRSSYYYM